MCGLFFVARRGAPIDRAAFETAFHTLRHRGPDHSAVRAGVVEADGPDGPVPVHWAAGHHRLAILDLDPRSNQPFARDAAVLVYNGEIYDYATVRRAAPFGRRPFDTDGDTEVLFEGLRREGPDFVARVNGMWAFAFADFAAGLIHASRDRFGKKPLFLHHDDATLCLASGLGAIDRFLGRQSRFDPAALSAFVAHGKLYPGAGRRTHHADIEQVPPSATVTLDLKTWTLSERRHFDFAAPQPERDLAPALADALRLRLVSDRPVGLLLSGGIDSSLLLSIGQATGRMDSLRCFIGDTGRSPDAAYAKECVDALGLKAEMVTLGYGADSFDRFLKICAHQEKPFPLVGNAMAMAEMYERVAGYGIAVALDGTGGDELFGGYWDRYFPFAVRDAMKAGDVKWLAGTSLRDRRRFKQAVGALFGTRRPRPKASTLLRFDPGAVASSDPLDDETLTFDEALVADASRGRLGDWLWQNDRNAMMASIENRSPLLDWRLAAFLRSGYRAKQAGPWNKLELRNAFDAFRPLPTQWRVQKQGFRWDRKAFVTKNRDAVRELLTGSAIVDDLVQRGRLIERLDAGQTPYASELVYRLLAVAGVAQAMNG